MSTSATLPRIQDNDFYQAIAQQFGAFQMKKIVNPTYEELCNPQQYNLQESQKFLAAYIGPGTPYKGILVYHQIGSGKTCSAIRIAEGWKSLRKIIVVLPASLKNNFKNEIRSQCTGDEYLSKADRKQLQTLDASSQAYRDIILKSDLKINKHYRIYSYHKFVNLVNEDSMDLTNAILIVDEIQNMISKEGRFYTALSSLINRSDPELRVVLLSATPMFDKPNEIAQVINLLRPIYPLPIGSDFNATFIESKKVGSKYIHAIKNQQTFLKSVKGYVSFFRGALSITYPHTTVTIKKCIMSDFQYKMYSMILKKDLMATKVNWTAVQKEFDMTKLNNMFYTGTRIASNVVFPNKEIGDQGLASLTNDVIATDLEKYSCKFDALLKSIKTQMGKIFIYSDFLGYGGVATLRKILDANGYKYYFDANGSNTEGEETGNMTGSNTEGEETGTFDDSIKYVIWSGNEGEALKGEIIRLFNAEQNIHGAMIKILIGTSAIKEGVSLLETRHVHILGPYWNMSRIKQIIGRATRYCSHKRLVAEARTVDVAIYVATMSAETILANKIKRKKTPNEIGVMFDEKTVDQYIMSLAKEKEQLTHNFSLLLRAAAVDCRLNKAANDEGSEDVKCI